MSQQHPAAYIRHGQTPFFRLPVADVETAGADAYRGAQAVLLGVPWDASVTYRPGARFAPYELRRVSALVQSYHPTHEVDVFESVKAVDGGNVVVAPFNAEASRGLIQAEVAHIAEAGAVPFVVGGDHSIVLPTLRALQAKHGPLAVVHVDAHLDTSSEETWGEPFHHGTPFRHAIGEKLIAPEALFQVGIRATWAHADEGQLADDFGARRYDMDFIEDQGIASVAAQIREHVGSRPTYVSFDIDAVDPAFAPGTGTPVPGGMTSREAFRLIRALRGVKLVGMDLTEVSPAYDHADLTLYLGAHLLFEGLALLA